MKRDFDLWPARQSRLVIGHVTSAGHRLSRSRDGGIGLCTLAGLVEAARQSYDILRVGGCDDGCDDDFGRRKRERFKVCEFGIVVLVRGASVYHHFVRFDLVHHC